MKTTSGISHEECMELFKDIEQRESKSECYLEDTGFQYKYSDYMDAIKHTKIRLKVDKGYEPFLIQKGLLRGKGGEDYIMVLNIINSRKDVPLFYKFSREGSAEPQNMFEKQMHFDFLLHTIPKTPKKKKKTSK